MAYQGKFNANVTSCPIYSNRERLYSFSHFVLSAQASSAQVKSFWLTIYSDSNSVDIRQPAPIGAAFRMAHIVAELG